MSELPEPTEGELIAIFREAMGRPLRPDRLANVDITASNMFEGTGFGSVIFNLELIKMLTLATYKYRKAKT